MLYLSPVTASESISFSVGPVEGTGRGRLTPSFFDTQRQCSRSSNHRLDHLPRFCSHSIYPPNLGGALGMFCHQQSTNIHLVCQPTRESEPGAPWEPK